MNWGGTTLPLDDMSVKLIKHDPNIWISPEIRSVIYILYHIYIYMPPQTQGGPGKDAVPKGAEY